MKKILLLLLIAACSWQLPAQPLLHSHNDYFQPYPLITALQNHVFSIEVDVFLANSQLVVAHVKKDIRSAFTLDSLYIQPIIRLFQKHNGHISENKDYAPILMIDIKENSEVVLPELIKLLASHRPVFDHSINPTAVQIVISGDRGDISKWTSYPAYIFFDGRPYESYDSATLQRLAFISDAYGNYVSTEDIEALVKKVYAMGKLLRL